VFSVRCAVFGVQCSVCSVRCSVFSVQCSVFSVRCAVFGVQCSVFSVQCAVFGVQCSVCSVHCAVFSVQCSVCSVRCSVFGVQCSVFSVQGSVSMGHSVLAAVKSYGFRRNLITCRLNSESLVPIYSLLRNPQDPTVANTLWPYESRYSSPCQYPGLSKCISEFRVQGCGPTSPAGVMCGRGYVSV